MFKLFPNIATLAAASAFVLCLGVGTASADVTRYHQSNGDVVTINTPNVSAFVGATSKSQVSVSVTGPSPLVIANEKFLTAYGWGDSQWDGLSFAGYGCWAKTLYSGQSCTSTIAFTPASVGSLSESYMLATGSGTLYSHFTATGLRQYRVVSPVGSGMLAP
jgi:hypothetical protein